MAVQFRLRELLDDRQLTQTELQFRTGLAYSTISDLYHNKARRIDVGTLDAICRALECAVSDLLTYVPDQPRSRGVRTS